MKHHKLLVQFCLVSACAGKPQHFNNIETAWQKFFIGICLIIQRVKKISVFLICKILKNTIDKYGYDQYAAANDYHPSHLNFRDFMTYQLTCQNH